MSQPLDLPTTFKSLTYSHDDFGARLFESITMGLYARPLHAIREYVQNEIDPHPKPSIVKIRLEGNRLSIWGDGKGMDEADIEIAKKVGFSDKNPVNYAGFRGIGIWSGVAIADEILVSTKKRDCPKVFYLRIDGKGIRKEINSNIPLKTLLEKNVSLGSSKDLRWGEHFTHVELRHIIPEVRNAGTWSEENIRQYIAEVLPVNFEPEWPYRDEIDKKLAHNVPDYRYFPVEFNGKLVFRPPYIKDLEAPQTGFLFDEKKRRIAFYWFCINKQRGRIAEEDYPRLIIRKKGFAVGDRRSCVPYFKEGEHLLSWTTGEIHVLDEKLVPDAARMDFESSVEKQTFVNSISQNLAPFLEEEVRKKSHRETLLLAVREIDELSLKPPRVKSIEEKIQLIRGLADLEKKLSRGKPAWTSDELERQRKAKLETVKKLKTKFLRLRPSATVAAQAPVTIAIPEEVPAESEASLVELAEELSVNPQGRMILEVVETVLTDLTESDLRTRIKERISEELARILKGK